MGIMRQKKKNKIFGLPLITKIWKNLVQSVLGLLSSIFGILEVQIIIFGNI